VGGQMSGYEFLGNSNSQVHIGYGLRREKNTRNFSVFTGLTYFTGVLSVPDSILGFIPAYYQGMGIYASGQVIFKFKYDIGVGVEVFGEYSVTQQILGLKFIMFFSSAYKGPKKNFNPNVRSENKK